MRQIKAHACGVRHDASMSQPSTLHAARHVPRYTSYPTAPHFSGEVGAALYRSWLAALDLAEPISVYVHVPFCAELCLYCGCQTTVTRKHEPVSAYLDLLLRELTLVGRALGARRRVSHLHFGGGSPTILDPSEFGRVMAALGAAFAFDEKAERAIEIDPRFISPAHVGALARVGINRVSIGIQSFDPLVQQTIRRRQSFELTVRVVDWFRFAGVAGVNLDLMYGLPHQTVANVLETVHRALSLDPDRIALFGYAHVPWMKRHQALLPEAALPDSAQRAEQFQAAAERIVAAGYRRIGLDHFAKSDDDLALKAAQSGVRRNFQGYTTDNADALIGLGASAISRCPQGYAQNASAVADYREAVLRGALPTARGVSFTAGDRLRADVIERLMCDFRVDLEALCKRHRLPLAELDTDLGRLMPIVADGLAHCDGAVISIPAACHNLTRIVCTAFDARSGLTSGGHSAAL